MIEKFFKLLIILRYPVVIASIAAFLYFGYHASFIETEPSATIDSILGEDDSARVGFDEMKKKFHQNEGDEIYIAVKAQTIYSERILSFLAKISGQIEALDGVESLTDLFTAYSITGNSEGEILIEPFMRRDNPDLSAEAIGTLRDKIRSDPFAAERLVNAEGSATVVVVHLEDSLDASQKRVLTNTVSNLLCKEQLALTDGGIDMQIHIVGDSIVQRAIADVQAGEGFIFPLMICTLALILFVIFRSISGVAIPVLIMMISVISTIGVKALIGSKMSTVDPMLYALITTIAVSDSIHIVSSWYNARIHPGLAINERIAAVLSHSLYPCFLTAITSAIGFASIAVTKIPQTRWFGLIAGAGIMGGFVWTFILTGPLLRILHPISGQLEIKIFARVENRIQALTERLSDTLSKFVVVHAKKIVILFSVITLLSAASILRIRTGTNPYSFLKDTHPVNAALSFIETNFSGIDSIDLIVKSDESGFFRRAENLAGLARTADEISAVAGVTRVDSLLKMIRQMNRAMYGGKEQSYVLPGSDNQIAQYLLLYEMSEDSSTLAQWASEDYSELRLHILVKHGSDIDVIRKKIGGITGSAAYGSPVESTLTGSAILWNRIDRFFIHNQLLSLFISVIVIPGMLFFVFQSIRLGVYCVIVNLSPVIFGLGFMGITGIELSMGTVMISSIAIGIACDDTVHFVFRCKEEAKKSRGKFNFARNLAAINRITLRPVVFTSVILAIGFFSNMLSSFKPNAYFGLISGLVIVVAAVAEVFWMPALIELFGYEGKR